MREQLETFVKSRRGLAITIVIVAALALTFVVPQMFASLDQGGKKTFWMSFFPSFGIVMLLLFPRKNKAD